MNTCQHDAKEHLHKAREHLHEAARVWTDHLIHPEVRSHLRDAARSVLQAGIAAIDAEERRRHPPTEAPPAPPT